MQLKTVIVSLILLINVGCGSSSEDGISPGVTGTNTLSDSTNRPQVAPQIIKPTPVISGHMPTLTPTYHPLILSKTPAPLNRPHSDPTPVVNIPYEPVLPVGGPPISVMAVNGELFRGNISSDANISITQNLIHAITGDGDSIKVAYKLPSSLDRIPDRTFPGSILVENTTTIASANKNLSVNDQNGLVFYEAIASSKAPIALEPTSGIKLLQSPDGQAGATNPGWVSLGITTQDDTIALINGQNVTVQAAGGIFQVYLQSSYKLSSSPNATDPFAGYQLHVWIIRTN